MDLASVPVRARATESGEADDTAVQKEFVCIDPDGYEIHVCPLEPPAGL